MILRTPQELECYLNPHFQRVSRFAAQGDYLYFSEYNSRSGDVVIEAVHDVREGRLQSLKASVHHRRRRYRPSHQDAYHYGYTSPEFEEYTEQYPLWEMYAFSEANGEKYILRVREGRHRGEFSFLIGYLGQIISYHDWLGNQYEIRWGIKFPFMTLKEHLKVNLRFITGGPNRSTMYI